MIEMIMMKILGPFETHLKESRNSASNTHTAGNVESYYSITKIKVLLLLCLTSYTTIGLKECCRAEFNVI